MARSLVEGLGLESVGRARPGRPGGRARGERIKAVLALSMLVLAGGILSWHFGLGPVSSGPAIQPVTPEDVAELKRQQDANQAIISRGGGREGDS